MNTFFDQLGNLIPLNQAPQRIISLVPSHTEMLFDLKLGKRIVGVTKFCTRPHDGVEKVTKVGGTKQLDIPAIIALNPDLIIANKEENSKEEIEYLQRLFPVWISDIYTLNDSYNMIESIGLITESIPEAEELIALIKQAFIHLKKNSQFKKRLKVSYFIWRKPYMVAAKNTFIDHVMNLAEFDNAFHSNRYPVVSPGELASANPDLIFLSSEPYPFKERHIAEFKAICPEAQILLVDGEMFSWYGSRLKYTPKYLDKIISENFKKFLQD